MSTEPLEGNRSIFSGFSDFLLDAGGVARDIIEAQNTTTVNGEQTDLTELNLLFAALGFQSDAASMSMSCPSFRYAIPS